MSRIVTSIPDVYVPEWYIMYFYFQWHWRCSQKSPIGQTSEETQEGKLSQLSAEIIYEV